MEVFSYTQNKQKHIWKQWCCDLKASLAPHCLTGEKDHIQGSLQSELRNLPNFICNLSTSHYQLSLWWHQLSIISRTCSERLHLNTCYSLQLECYLYLLPYSFPWKTLLHPLRSGQSITPPGKLFPNPSFRPGQLFVHFTCSCLFYNTCPFVGESVCLTLVYPSVLSLYIPSSGKLAFPP